MSTPAEVPQPGNVARFAARPLPGGGTPTHAWLNSPRDFPELDVARCREIIVVAPHPDDETLGFGATAAMLAEAGVTVQVVSVSDGGAANPGMSSIARQRLERTRRAELRRALAVLGLPEPTRLELPDGELAEYEPRLADELTEILASRPGAWCAATWRGDGHPDHEAVGRAAALAAAQSGAVLLEYPVWMWHWARPGDAAVPWHRARRVSLSHSAAARKQAAAQWFRSQFDVVGGEVVLPPSVLRRLLAVGEMVFV